MSIDLSKFDVGTVIAWATDPYNTPRTRRLAHKIGSDDWAMSGTGLSEQDLTGWMTEWGVTEVRASSPAKWDIINGDSDREEYHQATCPAFSCTH